MNSVEIFLLAAAALLLLCVFASKVSGKLGIPTLVFFIFIGGMAGSEGPGGIYFDNASYTQTLGVIALAYILFSGGLDTKWKNIRPVLKSGLSLATFGVLITCLLMGLFVHYVLSFSLLEGLLIGAIVSSTDAGAVFSVLRSRSINLKEKIKSILELESGSNDPMAVFLTVLIISLIKFKDTSAISFIPTFFGQMIIGGFVGYTSGRFAVFVFNKIRLQFEGLYTVMSLAIVLLIYSLTQSINGNGFLAVYISGLVLGNSNFIYKNSIILLHDGISWLMQSCLFLTLGLLIYPSRVFDVGATGFMIASFLILIARPVSVFISLSLTDLNLREKIFISWVGLRGSVPIVMATYPMVANIERADFIFYLVFFVALTSLLIQGGSVSMMSKLLKVEGLPTKARVGEFLTQVSPSKLTRVYVPKTSFFSGKAVIDLGLPDDLLIVLIERMEKTIIPRGSTTIEAEDKLYVLAEKSSLDLFLENINKK